MDIRYGRKKSGIRRELKAKLDEWMDSIDDSELVVLIKKDVIVTGGSIASMLLGEQVNDYDIYFRTQETTKRVAEYYVNKFNEIVKLKLGDVDSKSGTPCVQIKDLVNIKGQTESCVVIYMKSSGVAGENQETYEYFEGMGADATQVFADSLSVNDAEQAIETRAEELTKGKYRPVFMSQNAITLSNKMQLVTRFYGEPDKIHDNYDFQHAMSYYDYHNDVLETSAEALECLLSRTLVYRGSLYPVASIFRMKKFLERGWRITAGQQLKIMWQISEIDLKNFEVMRSQLVGVDQAYMWQLIQALKDVEPEKINSTYIATIIDRIFE
jgi:hypothetical protein